MEEPVPTPNIVSLQAMITERDRLLALAETALHTAIQERDAKDAALREARELLHCAVYALDVHVGPPPVPLPMCVKHGIPFKRVDEIAPGRDTRGYLQCTPCWIDRCNRTGEAREATHNTMGVALPQT